MGSPLATTLLLTNSLDYCADLLVDGVGSEHVFRYNSDLWQDYKLVVTGTHFEIENPTGKSIRDSDIVKVYRRSFQRSSTLFPYRAMSAQDRYVEEEVWTAWNDIVNMLWHDGKVVLIQPLITMRLGKLQQLRLARAYFEMPSFKFIVNAAEALQRGRESVAKSFSFKFDTGVGFYARKVCESDLDPLHPWFLTDYVEAEQDVTVVAVRDELFAFSLDRFVFVQNTIDWRLASGEYAQRNWRKVNIPARLSESIFAFMADAAAHYARIDFLKAGDRYIFLEANFTGEWAWLDPDGTNGLMAKVIREIHPLTPRVSCPMPRW